MMYCLPDVASAAALREISHGKWGIETMKTISEQKCFDGIQGVYEHASETCHCPMRFGVFIPPQAKNGPAPVLTYLSGLTCTEENFVVKAGAQRIAAELGFIIVAPDTSPRGDDVADSKDEYDMGKGAGFYLDATEEPWSRHYHMYSYIVRELPDFIAANFPVDKARRGIFGHSMGGHGALTIHLRNPDLYPTVSAFSPIVAPTQVPWGQKAFSRYLGENKESWAPYDATLLVEKSPSAAHILIDQGDKDGFLAEQLRPELFKDASARVGQKLTLRMQPGYDHSYFFISTFMEDHLRWHAAQLAG
jgi:S-formylglutathione hydrolase